MRARTRGKQREGRPMRRQISILMAGSALSLTGYAIPAAAADTAAADRPEVTQDGGVDRGSDEAIFEDRRDIIVYARREAELISDVPQTVEAISGEELARLSLRSEERRVGKECVSKGRSRWSPDP